MNRLFRAALLLAAQMVIGTAQAQTASDLLEITPRTSQARVSSGSDFGISVDIRNKSRQPVYFHPRCFTITLPPELVSGEPTGWAAAFTGRPPKTDESFFEDIVRLEPGGTTSAFWARPRTTSAFWARGRRESSGSSRWTNMYRYVAEESRQLTFSPGEYTVKVIAISWTKEENAGKGFTDDSRSQVLDIKLPVTAPQWVILFGAVIGGLIAYFLLPSVRIRPTISFVGLFTSALLSLMVTILLSRISETQFLIRVTINDLWGAMAMGFIGSASGTTVLKKIIPAEHEGAVDSHPKTVTSERQTESAKSLDVPVSPEG